MSRPKSPSIQQGRRHLAAAWIRLLVAVLAAAFWLAAETGTAGQRKPRQATTGQATTGQPGEQDSGQSGRAPRRGRRHRRAEASFSGRAIDDRLLRNLPDDCGVIGWVDVDAILHSQIGRELLGKNANFLDESQDLFAPLSLRVEQIEYVAYGARALSSGDLAQPLAMFALESPLEASSGDSADPGSWRTEQVGSRTVWIKAGEAAWAIAAVDEQTVLAGDPETLKAVLRRDAPAELPRVLDRACRLLETSSAIAMTILPDESGEASNAIGFPFASDLLEKVEAVNLELDFGAELDLRFTAICGDEQAARQLHGVMGGLWALVQSQGSHDQDPATIAAIRSVRIDVDQCNLIARMTIPSDLVELTDESEGGLLPIGAIQTVPSTGPSTGPTTGPALPGSISSVENAAVSACDVAPAVAEYPASPSTPAPYPTAAPCPQPVPTHSSYPPPPTGNPYYGHPQPLASRPVLPIADVLRLVEAGVDEEVITRHIVKHSLASALTADDLILLTKAEVGLRVITTLQELPVAPPAAPTQATYDPHAQPPEPDSSSASATWRPAAR